ncbi:hypothetical protein BaRGS_00016989 [Batillaria attramentaria]|uniref:Uncharacterized protein n=1 Tax=Batillaria attramentaria TaxID=370345 RepID=A0ABD0KXQ1_9CAEN
MGSAPFHTNGRVEESAQFRQGDVLRFLTQHSNCCFHNARHAVSLLPTSQSNTLAVRLEPESNYTQSLYVTEQRLWACFVIVVVDESTNVRWKDARLITPSLSVCPHGSAGGPAGGQMGTCRLPLPGVRAGDSVHRAKRSRRSSKRLLVG